MVKHPLWLLSTVKSETYRRVFWIAAPSFSSSGEKIILTNNYGQLLANLYPTLDCCRLTLKHLHRAESYVSNSCNMREGNFCTSDTMREWKVEYLRDREGGREREGKKDRGREVGRRMKNYSRHQLINHLPLLDIIQHSESFFQILLQNLWNNS